MPGGLLQLVAYGSQNFYLNGNPSLSFFKKVFKPYTNFSTESIKLNFNRTTINFNEKTTLIAKIDRNGDMLQNMYFVFTLPSVKKYKDDDTAFEKFNYVKNIGEVIIDNCYVNIGGNIIDKQYGEWMHIWNELSIEASKRYGYDKLIGNIPELYSPDDHNYFRENQIQIYERKVYVPLKFWFNRNPGLALPLISLQYHQVELVIELRPFRDLFTINDKKPTLNDFNKYFSSNVLNTSLNSLMYLETTYVFLDTSERTFFAVNSQDYLIEQVVQIQESSISTNAIVNLPLHNPVKELIWVIKRSDVGTTNKWFEFIDWEINDHYYEHDEHTDDDGNDDNHEHDHAYAHINHSHIETERKGEIMKSACILFNGLERLERKDNSYFNLIQPYQHHTFIPKEGIYVYSFSLFPETFQPSGSCNMSKINKVQLSIESINKIKVNVERTRQIRNDDDNTLINETYNSLESLYDYDLTLYAVNYNFLRIISGLAGLAYAC